MVAASRTRQGSPGCVNRRVVLGRRSSVPPNAKSRGSTRIARSRRGPGPSRRSPLALYHHFQVVERPTEVALAWTSRSIARSPPRGAPARPHDQAAPARRTQTSPGSASRYRSTPIKVAAVNTRSSNRPTAASPCNDKSSITRWSVSAQRSPGPALIDLEHPKATTPAQSVIPAGTLPVISQHLLHSKINPAEPRLHGSTGPDRKRPVMNEADASAGGAVPSGSFTTNTIKSNPLNQRSQEVLANFVRSFLDDPHRSSTNRTRSTSRHPARKT